MLDLSIIIVSFNTKKLTDDCLSSIYKTLKNVKFTYEIIVVDNVSQDGSVDMIEKKYKKVVLIKNSENIGFGRANNQGMKRSNGEYIFLLNSDTIVLPNAIQKLYQFAKNHRNAFVGPKLLNMDRSPQTSCGPMMTIPVVFATLFCKGDVLGITRWSPSQVKKVGWVSGAALIGNRSLFFDDLLFDEKIFMYMEEIDLLYRAKQKGYMTYFYPASHIVHLGGGSSTNKRKGPVLNIYKGFIFFYTKHYSKFHISVLKSLLRLKALLAILFGKLTRNYFLVETYEEAYRLV